MILKSIIFLWFFASTVADVSVKIQQVDHVIDSLSSQQWDDDEAICQEKIFSLLNNVKNSTLWATWIWDSTPQAPTGTFFGARFHLGNYDQCLRPPWLSEHPELRTQYCLADVEMSKNPAVKNLDLPGPYARAEEYYVDGTTDTGRSFSYMSYGVCVPTGCENKSVEKYVKALLSGQHLKAAWDAYVKIHHCEEAGAPTVRPRGYYVYMYTLAVLAFIAIASTYYIRKYTDTASTNTFVNHVAKSFCLRRNWATVFKEDNGALTCLHSIRFLSSVIIVRAHVSMFTNSNSVANGMDHEAAMQSYSRGIPGVHFDLHVDTFFAMAGLLLGKSLSTMDVSKPSNLLKTIIRRYLRLIGPLAATVFYTAHVIMYVDSGPQYPRLKLKQQACEQNWWQSLLMVGNYINSDNMCHQPTWSAYCDFHFYVMTLVLLYVYRKNPKLGKIVGAIVVFVGVIAPGISTYLYDLPAVWTLNLGYMKNFTKGYIKTHNRMGPYVAGLLVGYLMSIYNPADYKNKCSKITSFLGVCAGLTVMGSVLAVGYVCFNYRVYGALACLYMMLDRTTFAVGVLCVIIFCTYCDVPVINSFLKWSIFKPLSHLSYGVYLIHPVLLYKSKTAQRDHMRNHPADMMVETFGLVILSLILSMTLWLLVEAPLNNFASRYLVIRSQSKEEVREKFNGTSKTEVTENKEDKQKVM